MSRHATCRSLFLAATLIIITTAGTTAQTTHVVDATGNGQFKTIAAAIAKARDGDKIVVRKGVYATSPSRPTDARAQGQP